MALDASAPPHPATNLVFPTAHATYTQANYAAHDQAPATPALASSTPLTTLEGEGSSLLTFSQDELAAIIANMVAQANSLSLPHVATLEQLATHATHLRPFHAYITTWQAHLHSELPLFQPLELPLPHTMHYGSTVQATILSTPNLGMPFLELRRQDPQPLGITPFICKLAKPIALYHGAPPSHLVTLTANNRATLAKV
ncbi:hypothetical protein H0H87_010309 [Tephrocybe sp. NHM501043]|nr:hypothetical protein H0H87_010309 [Tephrocybe sp. NHM501043]